jgi:ubiquinone/menaquinone biosynthesis C-methylase UbiE
MSATRPGDFSPQAEAYAKARPGYPRELVDHLMELAEIAPGDAAAEVGAGTGIFTALLAGRGLRLTALEPNAGMRAKARPLPGVEWRDGTFEETGLGTSSQRWAVAAQAFHWAKPERALPEIHRVLVPGGRFTVLWNNRDVASSEVLRWTRDAVERLVPHFDEGYRARDWGEVLTSTGHFLAPAATEVHHTVAMSDRRYLDLWRSHNLLNAAAGPEGMAALLDEIAGRLAGRERIEVPYLCRAWTVQAAVRE